MTSMLATLVRLSSWLPHVSIVEPSTGTAQVSTGTRVLMSRKTRPVKIPTLVRGNLTVVATLEIFWTFVQCFEGYRRWPLFGVQGLLWGAVVEQSPGPGVELFHD